MCLTQQLFYFHGFKGLLSLDLASKMLLTRLICALILTCKCLLLGKITKEQYTPYWQKQYTHNQYNQKSNTLRNCRSPQKIFVTRQTRIPFALAGNYSYSDFEDKTFIQVLSYTLYNYQLFQNELNQASLGKMHSFWWFTCTYCVLRC